MTLYDRYIAVDWSGGNDTGPTPKADAIWVAVYTDGPPETPHYIRNRLLAEEWLTDQISDALANGARLCVGFDFAFGYPDGFGRWLTASDDPLAVWDWLGERVEDSPKINNRFDVAAAINARCGGIGPFWGNGLKRDIPHLPRKGLARTCEDFPERRQVEHLARGSFPCWQLSGAGAVGSQIIMGLPVLNRLRRRFAGDISVWPFEPLTAPISFVEIWPSLLASEISDTMSLGDIKDARQVEMVANVMARMDHAGTLHGALEAAEGKTEGWILGVGSENSLKSAARPVPPLRNDCFALPPGVDWTPVDEALERLERAITPVVGQERVPAAQADGRITSRDVVAIRSNPPAANSAVDGFGFAHASLPAGAQTIPLVTGRAAAGGAYPGTVPAGQAIRILTGALLPEGVDTVVLEEDCTRNGDEIRVSALPKPGANSRKAGEDVAIGEVILKAGAMIGPPELALCAATGVAELDVFTRLKVGVLSTGDELIAPTSDARPDQTFDANRPMLLSLLSRWGYDPVDLGHSKDDRDLLRATLNDGSRRCDAILTSGGASAGDEDHVSALLKAEGSLSNWRIALKPGRPLALAQWHSVPIFGLPGNPVAALVCALVFARPALSKLAGGTFAKQAGFMVPAAFKKKKKPGRREYLRARLQDDGRVTVFKSEGSGRISGLSWAGGLVELPDGAMTISEGTPVKFIPYSAFGL
ncbi:hypothetical protein KIN_21210 [Litoreibacter roseus]|uniref:Molybdopterin molybdenumtransferase n=1 Tax=Litoreibacter roseus TaxID=2601869 RepID=A0A6N6JGG1_9RHOB|nr:hypothetical protein KIN_21210 [Litoreibacter roseus]